MDCLLKPVEEWNRFPEILSDFTGRGKTLNISGPSDSQKVHFLSALIKQGGHGRKYIYLANNDLTARKIYEDFQLFFGNGVVLLSAADYMFYDVDVRSSDALNDRMKAFEMFLYGDFIIAVVPVSAAIQCFPDPSELKSAFIKIHNGMKTEPRELMSRLVRSGYERVPLVSGRGQFALRGDILDVYGLTMDEPVRIEFFDDEVDSIRFFDSVSQRAFSSVSEVLLPPAQEFLLGGTEGPERRIEEALERETAGMKELGLKDMSRRIEKRVGNDLEMLKNSINFAGSDRYIPFFTDKRFTIFDFIPDAVIFEDEPQRLRETVNAQLEDHNRICETIHERSGLLKDVFHMLCDFETFETLVEKSSPKLVILSVSSAFGRSFDIPSKSMDYFLGNFELLTKQISEWKVKKYKIAILTGQDGRSERMLEMLSDHGIEAAIYGELPEELPSGQVSILSGSLHSGFEYPECGLAVVSDSQFFKHITKRRSKHKGMAITSFSDIKPGDLIVHLVHGIGRFEGLENIKVDNIVREYIKIQYRDEGILFVPVEQLDNVQKYIGPEGRTPKLNKLGGKDWVNAKSKVKESLREYAQALVELYARRSAINGYAFSKDTVWQKEFEDGFQYEETDDQLTCADEIKADMEQSRPMERLLCGDVGYGKTEVALRAAFKAVCDDKQVAFLVPTTVLAQQHYNNFIERFKNFPVKVDYICRFRTPNEQKSILKRVHNGEIDILIGTHRLLQKDIEFKNLGLLVIDEEQRFGVMHKEKLKQERPEVDILTLSATPIPRTLHMSLSGIRDISLLEEPPRDRHPVQTYVNEWEPEIIKNAIYREMGRKGQVFYLYNKVKTISEKALQLSSMIPEARIAIAHGQMAERELEDVMADFLKGEYDILLCTTIIESGLDMPNTNTVIVEDGDKLGLAQLYQIRGRVGRSDRLAYAYITYKKDKSITEIAEKRLQAIREFTEFGAGFKIAMRDLEIRGAGNVLGAEQHGQLEAVGYDMYCRLLGEAVNEVRGKESETHSDVSVDLKISAFIDSSYIEDEESRLELYQRIARIEDKKDILDVTDESVDRYGDLPEEVNNLIKISYMRHLAGKYDISSITEKNQLVIFTIKPGVSIASLKWLPQVMNEFKGKLLFNAGADPYVAVRVGGKNPQEVLDEALNTVVAISKDS
ncbi:MAG: transcription-repair coupling factor [Clostridiales bacterium]|jgi:transcription-repair coupling factor (superfamily II helicase)|nr:transcription-repair coupling factor [Clostridiales bacterium]